MRPPGQERLSEPQKPLPAGLLAQGGLAPREDHEVGPAVEGLARGTVGPIATAGAAPRESEAGTKPTGPRPFAHPYYWAAFILVGDPS